jgi:hypothetical protein
MTKPHGWIYTTLRDVTPAGCHLVQRWRQIVVHFGSEFTPGVEHLLASAQH